MSPIKPNHTYSNICFIIISEQLTSYNILASQITGSSGVQIAQRLWFHTHCTEPILLTRALSLNESYEAACICRLVAVVLVAGLVPWLTWSGCPRT